MTLINLFVAWVLGSMVARLSGASVLHWAGASLIGAVTAVRGWRQPRGGLIVGVLGAFLLGGWRYLATRPAWDERNLAYYNDADTITLLGHVSGEPSGRATYVQLQVSARQVEADGAWHAVRGKLVCDVPLYPEYEYGDDLRLAGRLETPTVYADFDYREYLAARGVGSVMRRPKVSLTGNARGNPFLRLMLRGKGALLRVIEAILPNPESGLLAGVLLGLGHTLPGYLEKAFRRTGLAHLVVISGLNLTQTGYRPARLLP